MKATRFSLTFVVLALCSSGHAGPCKPRSSTALVGTTSTEATLSASTEISTATSVAESSTADLSSIISESITSTLAETSDSQLSSSTELLSSSVTTDTATVTTSAAELSSTVETLTASTTAEAITTEATTTEAPTTTTAEVSVPSNLFLNPSFDEPNGDGDFDGSPWTLSDSVSPLSVTINSDLAHSGSHSAYWSIENTAQNGVVSQTVDIEQFEFYTLSYWWYVDEDTQPQNIDCYIIVDQTSTDGLTSTSAGFHPLTSPLPLKTWTKRETIFNSINIAPAKMGVSVLCGDSAGSGIKVAIDDVKLGSVTTPELSLVAGSFVIATEVCQNAAF
ncbi:uncharacterized protein FTJAE_12936 [Fusarium tjaetaba]|uniref:CBM-cenC domain-containing protein n=1 Tax=Fusarium tjaetaba TaxID=1567544 RepID=A0A8H5VA37_9HYPO|nr:uncharacterized protein FTJAE_12936 [Fusarium tjaetaba]KAF5616787.1 hypothetical protein FTJAE_12936 [Fusarium tjaetaba]